MKNIEGEFIAQKTWPEALSQWNRKNFVNIETLPEEFGNYMRLKWTTLIMVSMVIVVFPRKEHFILNFYTFVLGYL